VYPHYTRCASEHNQSTGPRAAGIRSLNFQRNLRAFDLPQKQTANGKLLSIYLISTSFLVNVPFSVFSL
jgi:hypothetical protein